MNLAYITGIIKGAEYLGWKRGGKNTVNRREFWFIYQALIWRFWLVG